MKPLGPRVGSFAYDEEGVLGLITQDQKLTGSWHGISVDPPHRAGEKWTSRNPEVVAGIELLRQESKDAKNLLRCAVCGALITIAEAKEFKACSVCGTNVAPEFVYQDVLLRANWTELRMLANWAFQFALAAHLPSEAHQRLARVAQRIRLLRPERAPALLDSEVQEEAAVDQIEQSLESKAAQHNQVKSSFKN